MPYSYETELIQRALRFKGYRIDVDGEHGPLTESAIRRSAAHNKKAEQRSSGDLDIRLDVPAHYQIAMREIGIKEFEGPSDNPRVVEYLRTLDIPPSYQEQDETPWCSGFVNWCVLKAGLNGTNNGAARSWLKWGNPVTSPQVGDIVILWRGRKDGWKGHVGFFVRQNSGTVTLLGGNQQNAVRNSDYDSGRILGFRRNA